MDHFCVFYSTNYQSTRVGLEMTQVWVLNNQSLGTKQLWAVEYKMTGVQDNLIPFLKSQRTVPLKKLLSSCISPE
jgi:hypothetical protein